MLNRAVLIVRPKQPYLDWAASLDDSGTVPNVTGEQTVYLITEYATYDEAQEVLEMVYAAVFEMELGGWHTDEAAWPPKRDFQTFVAWFSVEMHSVVEDTGFAGGRTVNIR